MIYSIHKLPDHPIYTIRFRPPMHLDKDIYAVDDEFEWFTRKVPGYIYRVDDFTLLREMDFTLSDAVLWLTGVIRDELYWDSRINHIAIGSPHIIELAQRITDERIDRLRVAVFPGVNSAVTYIHEDMRRRSRGK